MVSTEEFDRIWNEFDNKRMNTVSNANQISELGGATMSLMHKIHELLEIVKSIRSHQQHDHGDDHCCRQVLKIVTKLSQDVQAQTVIVKLLEQQNVEQGAQLDTLEEQVTEILATLSHQFRSLVISYFDQHGNPIPKELGMPLQLTDIQSVSATVSEVDAAGNPVPLDPGATVVWTVSDATILTSTQNPDNSVSLKAAGPLGSSQVAVQVTNPDGSVLNAQDTVNVVASAATGLAIQFGTPA